MASDTGNVGRNSDFHFNDSLSLSEGSDLTITLGNHSPPLSQIRANNSLVEKKLSKVAKVGVGIGLSLLILAIIFGGLAISELVAGWLAALGAEQVASVLTAVTYWGAGGSLGGGIVGVCLIIVGLCIGWFASKNNVPIGDQLNVPIGDQLNKTLILCKNQYQDDHRVNNSAQAGFSEIQITTSKASVKNQPRYHLQKMAVLYKQALNDHKSYRVLPRIDLVDEKSIGTAPYREYVQTLTDQVAENSDAFSQQDDGLYMPSLTEESLNEKKQTLYNMGVLMVWAANSELTEEQQIKIARDNVINTLDRGTRLATQITLLWNYWQDDRNDFELKDFHSFCCAKQIKLEYDVSGNHTEASLTNIETLVSKQTTEVKEMLKEDIVKRLATGHSGNENYIFRLGCVFSPRVFDALQYLWHNNTNVNRLNDKQWVELYKTLYPESENDVNWKVLTILSQKNQDWYNPSTKKAIEEFYQNQNPGYVNLERNDLFVGDLLSETVKEDIRKVRQWFLNTPSKQDKYEDSYIKAILKKRKDKLTVADKEAIRYYLAKCPQCRLVNYKADYLFSCDKDISNWSSFKRLLLKYHPAYPWVQAIGIMQSGIDETEQLLSNNQNRQHGVKFSSLSSLKAQDCRACVEGALNKDQIKASIQFHKTVGQPNAWLRQQKAWIEAYVDSLDSEGLKQFVEGMTGMKSFASGSKIFIGELEDSVSWGGKAHKKSNNGSWAERSVMKVVACAMTINLLKDKPTNDNLKSACGINVNNANQLKEWFIGELKKTLQSKMIG